MSCWPPCLARPWHAGGKPCAPVLPKRYTAASLPEEVRYSRQVTLAWTLFLLAISLISSVLFFFASIEVWSVFANFLSFPLILLMFAAEYLVRLRKLPHQKKHSIMDGMLAYWKTPAARPGASSDSR